MHLYQHFLANGLVVDVPFFNEFLLRHTPRDIQRMIAADEDIWKTLVPEEAHRSAPPLPLSSFSAGRPFLPRHGPPNAAVSPFLKPDNPARLPPACPAGLPATGQENLTIP